MLTLRKSYHHLTPILFGVAIISLASSVLFQRHLGEPTDLYHIFDISFYHFVPILLWFLYLPALYRFTFRFPLMQKDWQKHLPIHALVSLLFAPIARLLAISLDFWIKNQIGMVNQSVGSILRDVKWVIVASIPKELLIYWLVALLLSYWFKRHVPANLERLAIETSKGTQFVEQSEILWIESAKNYIQIHTAEGVLKSRKTLKTLSNELDGRFVQVHRSRIVNSDAIKTLSHWRNGEYLIKLNTGYHLTSTRTFLPNVKSLVD